MKGLDHLELEFPYSMLEACRWLGTDQVISMTSDNCAQGRYTGKVVKVKIVKGFCQIYLKIFMKVPK
jgi:hypothetical protein